MARTKRSTDKAKAATEKIDNLLKDTIGLTKEEPKDAVEESVQEKGNDWLADQIHGTNDCGRSGLYCFRM